MDIKQLKFLIALEQTRHFGQAAARCNITQPTLSMRLRNLEEELGLELVTRGQRFEGFTQAGERVLAWARTLLAAHDGLFAEAAACRGQLVGNLRLGLVPLSGFNPISFIQGLSHSFPELKFSLTSMSSDKIIEALGTNQLDLGVCYLDHVSPNYLEFFELGETRVGLLYDTRHFHFEGTQMSWEEAAELPLGMISNGMHYRKSIDLSFRSRGLDPQPILESDSTYQLFQAIHEGFCCAIMPLDSGLENPIENLAFIHLPDASVLAPLGMVMRKTEPRSVIAEKCFAEARQLFAPNTQA
ncbi:MAG: LysR family transcriptional regulator [Pseudomonadales bacterium RIFCSPLOWO2_12_60_38]|uniref:LysR family transcriptional regulator n=1 Tax=Pseudomonas paracarnis TaxID=2750625 RepID=A0ABU6C048_9PSED|nr:MULTISPECIES: LysR family transcriptional regulator [Pseudomonas]AFJ56088.1 transcriptional regulator, LysR family [Pseudomonas fluorescens A506]ETK42075.1 LysR family transcriptional regulator [Pseudomonas fluorescens FH5]KWV68182.1 Hydrogen peroxide-inducible activator [Pseudomonas fluorescens]MDN5485175.1 LysR family transcriptional regulator [Pseudomonas sp.]OHC33090.1 MAG: LysR family transcriptional regulator [Pseudomonadales bacterium RIFCSPLOWO2_12_60_38]OHC39296.1 MAG: LysR family